MQVVTITNVKELKTNKNNERYEFDNTRQYHTARKVWLNSLPITDEMFRISTRVHGPAAIEDLDVRMIGKNGIFFNMGTVFYEMWRMNNDRSKLYGWGKLIEPHPGALIAMLDDVQGFGFGEACMTKRLRISFEQPFDNKQYLETNKLVITTDVNRVSQDRTEIAGRVLCLDKENQLLAWSDTDFVQNAQLKELQMKQFSLKPEAVEAVREERWKLLAPYRLEGNSKDDPAMSFMLRVDTSEVKSLPYPKYWSLGETGWQAAPQNAILKGRVIMDHIAWRDGQCRAVVCPLATAEGPVGNMHGGCAATAWLDVLSHCTDISRIRVFTLYYKRPIPFGLVVSVNWTRVGCDWRCLILDSEKNVVQEVFAEFRPGTTQSRI